MRIIKNLSLACCIENPVTSSQFTFFPCTLMKHRRGHKNISAVKEQHNACKTNCQCRCINNSPEECRTDQNESVSQIKVCLELLKALHFPSLSPLFHSRWRGHLERIKALRTLDLPRAPGWMGGPLWTPFSNREQPHLINGGNLTRALCAHSRTFIQIPNASRSTVWELRCCCQ